MEASFRCSKTGMKCNREEWAADSTEQDMNDLVKTGVEHLKTHDTDEVLNTMARHAVVMDKW